MIFSLIFALSGLVPFHGVVLSPLPGHQAIVRNDTIPATLRSGVRRYQLAPAAVLRPGAGVDALLDRSTTPWTLRDAFAAAPFSPGIPHAGRVRAIDIGSALPKATLVDQNGRLIQLDRSFAGKTVLLSFIFTRCPDRDLCPAISGKFAYLQSQLNPTKFALVEITLDPPYDSPAILKRYGDAYGAKRGQWYLLTGTGTTIERVLNQFGIDSLRVSTSNFIHNDKLFIVTPAGRVAYVIDTAGWGPQGVVAEASAVAGMASNPFERFKLSLIASLVSLCGGSQYAGIVILELGLLALVTIGVFAGLYSVGRILWRSPD
jgi:protein SCO1/2